MRPADPVRRPPPTSPSPPPADTAAASPPPAEPPSTSATGGGSNRSVRRATSATSPWWPRGRGLRGRAVGPMSFGRHRSLDGEAEGPEPAARPCAKKGLTVGQPVVHFEIIGRDPAKLRSYYGELFGWEFQIGDATTDAVSQPGSYGFVAGATTGGGINGGVGGGEGYEGHVLFYVSVPNVEARARARGEPRRDAPDGPRRHPRNPGRRAVHRPRGEPDRCRRTRVTHRGSRLPAGRRLDEVDDHARQLGALVLLQEVARRRRWSCAVWPWAPGTSCSNGRVAAPGDRVAVARRRSATACPTAPAPPTRRGWRRPRGRRGSSAPAAGTAGPRPCTCRRGTGAS